MENQFSVKNFIKDINSLNALHSLDNLIKKYDEQISFISVQICELPSGKDLAKVGIISAFINRFFKLEHKGQLYLFAGPSITGSNKLYDLRELNCFFKVKDNRKSSGEIEFGQIEVVKPAKLKLYDKSGNSLNDIRWKVSEKGEIVIHKDSKFRKELARNIGKTDACSIVSIKENKVKEIDNERETAEWNALEKNKEIASTKKKAEEIVDKPETPLEEDIEDSGLETTEETEGEVSKPEATVAADPEYSGQRVMEKEVDKKNKNDGFNFIPLVFWRNKDKPDEKKIVIFQKLSGGAGCIKIDGNGDDGLFTFFVNFDIDKDNSPSSFHELLKKAELLKDNNERIDSGKCMEIDEHNFVPLDEKYIEELKNQNADNEKAEPEKKPTNNVTVKSMIALALFALSAAIIPLASSYLTNDSKPLSSPAESVVEVKTPDAEKKELTMENRSFPVAQPSGKDARKDSFAPAFSEIKADKSKKLSSSQPKVSNKQKKEVSSSVNPPKASSSPEKKKPVPQVSRNKTAINDEGKTPEDIGLVYYGSYISNSGSSENVAYLLKDSKKIEVRKGYKIQGWVVSAIRQDTIEFKKGKVEAELRKTMVAESIPVVHQVNVTTEEQVDKMRESEGSSKTNVNTSTKSVNAVPVKKTNVKSRQKPEKRRDSEPQIQKTEDPIPGKLVDIKIENKEAVNDNNKKTTESISENPDNIPGKKLDFDSSDSSVK